MEVNAYSDLNISDLSTNSTSSNQNTAYNSSSSLFNSLLAQNSDTKEEETTNRVKNAMTAFNELKKDVTTISSDTTNTHDELALMLKFKNLQAS